MGYFQVRYNSRVVIYDCKMFIRLATDGWIIFKFLVINNNEFFYSGIKTLPNEVRDKPSKVAKNLKSGHTYNIAIDSDFPGREWFDETSTSYVNLPLAKQLNPSK